jgi:hypothetical protein
VEYSRFSDPNGHLFVLDSAFEEIYGDPRVHAEMRRLREFSSQIPIFEGLLKIYEFPSLVQCVVHNTQSLLAHIDDIRSDHNMLGADIPIFTEARIRPSIQARSIDIPEYISDCGESAALGSPVNVMVYHKRRGSAFSRTTVSAISRSEFTIKYDTFALPGFSESLHLVSLYRSPHPTSMALFFQELEEVLKLQQRLRYHCRSPFLLCGDFNIDLFQPTKEAVQECSLLTSYALYQSVETHTTDFGSLLDHVWSNIPPFYFKISMQESFWSDHVPLLVSLSV